MTQPNISEEAPGSDQKTLPDKAQATHEDTGAVAEISGRFLLDTQKLHVYTTLKEGHLREDYVVLRGATYQGLLQVPWHDNIHCFVCMTEISGLA